MTRKNKLLSIVVVAIMFVACIFGFTFTNKTASADVTLPSVDSSSIEGALYVAPEGGSCPYIASKKSTTAEWIIFEWTNLVEAAITNGANSGYCYVGPNKGNQHGTSFGANAWWLFNKEYGEHVKLYFNTQTGQIYRVIDGGTPALVGTYTINNPDDMPMYASFCMHRATTAQLDDLKIYDSNGKNLMVGSSFSAHIDPPTAIASNKAQGVDIEFTGSNYAFYTEDFVYGEKLILEWTNGDITPRLENFAGGYRATYIVADKNNEASLYSPDPAGNEEYLGALHNLHTVPTNRTFYEDFATILVVFDMKNGGMPLTYIKSQGDTDFKQFVLAYSSNQLDNVENADNGEYKVSMWFNGILQSGKHNLTNVKAYDEKGNSYGLTIFNGTYTAKTVTFKDGANDFAKFEDAQPGRSFAQFTELAEPNKANFVGWTFTEGGVDFANDTAPVPREGATVYAKYATQKETDLSQYVGIYKSATQYFEITASGKVVSYNNVIPNGDLQVLSDATTKYARLAGAVGIVNGTTITVDGVAYEKTAAADIVEVKYYIDGKVDSSLKLPKGMKAPDKKVKILAKTFNGWRLYAAGAVGYYDFDKAINENTSFIADITINYAEETAYETYQFSYYNREENTIYIMRKNQTYTRLKVGEDPVVGSYKLVTDGDYTYAVFDADANKANNPIFIDKVSLQFDKVYNKLDPDGYNVLVKLDNGTEDKTYVANASTNYMVKISDTPTKTGYTFKGYKLGDDTAYDMNTIVTGAMTLYAVWESDGTIAPIEVKTGLSVVSIILIIVAGVALVGGGVYVFLMLKKQPAVAESAETTTDEGADNE